MTVRFQWKSSHLALDYETGLISAKPFDFGKPMTYRNQDLWRIVSFLSSSCYKVTLLNFQLHEWARSSKFVYIYEMTISMKMRSEGENCSVVSNLNWCFPSIQRTHDLGWSTAKLAILKLTCYFKKSVESSTSEVFHFHQKKKKKNEKKRTKPLLNQSREASAWFTFLNYYVVKLHNNGCPSGEQYHAYHRTQGTIRRFLITMVQEPYCWFDFSGCPHDFPKPQEPIDNRRLIDGRHTLDRQHHSCKPSVL